MSKQAEDALAAVRNAAMIHLKDAGAALKADAAEWFDILALGLRDLHAGRITGERYTAMLGQAQTSMALAGATVLAKKESLLLTAIQDAALKVAVLAAA